MAPQLCYSTIVNFWGLKANLGYYRWINKHNVIRMKACGLYKLWDTFLNIFYGQSLWISVHKLFDFKCHKCVLYPRAPNIEPHGKTIKPLMLKIEMHIHIHMLFLDPPKLTLTQCKYLGSKSEIYATWLRCAYVSIVYYFKIIFGLLKLANLYLKIGNLFCFVFLVMLRSPGPCVP